MENNQLDRSEWPQWVQVWVQQMTQPPFLNSSVTLEQKLLAEDAIAQIVLSNQAGDSCTVLAEPYQQALSPLALYIEQPTKIIHFSEIKPFVLTQTHAYLYRYWQFEQRLAQQVVRVATQHTPEVDISAYQNLFSNEAQGAALKMVAGQAFSIITGGPGTGKTYTLSRIIAVLNHVIGPLRIALAAPTGKAAQRMQEALQKAFQDPQLHSYHLVDSHLQQQGTQTIHRLLGLGHQTQPKFHAQAPLPYDVIVIDEASMLDIELATYLFEAVPSHCRLILLGDAQQLASVGVGSVLADLQMIKALASHHVHLQQSHRFNDQAHIGRLAKFIQSMADIDATAPHDDQFFIRQFEQTVQPLQGLTQVQTQDWPVSKIDEVRVQYLTESYLPQDLKAIYQTLFDGYADYISALKNYLNVPISERDYHKVIHAFDRYRVLCAVRHGALGLNRLNHYMTMALQNALLVHAKGDWYLGRPIMMLYNDYQLGLSNGDIGICLFHPEQTDQLSVYFPSLNRWVPAARLPSQIETAFALTIHKSQGSEFEHVAVILENQAERLLSQELLYTGITRAKKVVSLIVHAHAFAQSLRKKTIRESGLVNMIEQYIAKNESCHERI